MKRDNFIDAIDIAVERSVDKGYNIKQVACLLDISYSDTEDLCDKLYDYLVLNSKKSKTLRYLLSKFDKSSPVLCKLLTDALYELFIPYKMGKNASIDISEKEYKRLILLKKQDLIVNPIDKNILDKAMHIKLCHCIKKLYIKDIIVQNFINKNPKYNPYAICTSSIYNKRNIKTPPCAARNCSKMFNWYKDINYK